MYTIMPFDLHFKIPHLYMNYMDNEEAQHLYEQARLAAQQAYAPYSNFQVGAAVVTQKGNVYTGVNVENTSYGLTICAERIALGNSISSGSTDIRAIAVYARGASAAPCGACRQFILEFGEEIVVIFKQEDELVQMPVSELLPFAFTKKMLLP